MSEYCLVGKGKKVHIADNHVWTLCRIAPISELLERNVEIKRVCKACLARVARPINLESRIAPSLNDGKQTSDYENLKAGIE